MCLQDGLVKNKNWMNVKGAGLFARVFRGINRQNACPQTIRAMPIMVPG